MRLSALLMAMSRAVLLDKISFLTKASLINQKNQMRKLIFVATLLSCLFSFSQSKGFKVNGKIVSEEDEKPLEAATVYLERKKDSSLVTYTISDKNGDYQLSD